MRKVYLDHAATTPLDPQVLASIMPFLSEQYGNASSVHALGRRARFAVEESREQIADLLGAEPGEIMFTSGGTEGDNTAILGAIEASRGRGLITSPAEHEAVLRPADHLAHQGIPVTFLKPDPWGAVSPETVDVALQDGAALVSLMHANNEVGTLNQIREIGEVCRRGGVLLHSDAVQTAGLLPLSVDKLNVDLLTISAHKFYGPKGVGALYVRGGVELTSLIRGGAQERRRRGGTENVAGVVGMARALELATGESRLRFEHFSSLQRKLGDLLDQSLGGEFIYNTPIESAERGFVPHILSISFLPFEGEVIDGEMLLLNLDMKGVFVSSGSACTSGAVEPSHVLKAIGRDPATASATVRFSLGKDTTEDDILYAVEALSEVISRMRKAHAS